MANEAFYPSGPALRHELESRMLPAAWASLSDAEIAAMLMIIKGRSRKVVEAAFAEFSELITRAHLGKKEAEHAQDIPAAEEGGGVPAGDGGGAVQGDGS